MGTINTNQTSQIKSGDTVTVEQSCYIRTMDHVILADESETIEIQKKSMDWTGKLAELFNRANIEVIHTDIQGLRTKFNGEFNTSELFKEHDQIKPANALSMFTSPAAMIGIALAAFLIGMLIWKKCTNKNETPIPTPSAPLLPIQNPPHRTSDQ
jgi:hypothetical protein